MEFNNVDHVKAALVKADYICSKTIATVVFLAQATQKPVLVEGPAGVGKTELSKAVARSLDRRLIRLQCYEGLDETKALYEWEYAKQLLYTQMVKDKIDDQKHLPVLLLARQGSQCRPGPGPGRRARERKPSRRSRPILL